MRKKFGKNWYYVQTKKQKQIIKKEVIPLKKAMLNYLHKTLPIHNIPFKAKNYHKIIIAVIERAIQDCHTEIIKDNHAFHSAITFLSNKNDMLKYWLDMGYWEDTENFIKNCKLYTEKIISLRNKALNIKKKRKTITKFKIIKRKETIQ